MWRAGHSGLLAQAAGAPAPYVSGHTDITDLSDRLRLRPLTKTLILLWCKLATFIHRDQTILLFVLYEWCRQPCLLKGKLIKHDSRFNLTPVLAVKFHLTVLHQETLTYNLLQRIHTRCTLRLHCMSKCRGSFHNFFSNCKAVTFSLGLGSLWFCSFCHFKVKALCCATA